jgi:hypothetical protein
MSDDPAFGQFRKAHILVLPVNKWDKVCKPYDKKGRRVQIPLGPPPTLKGAIILTLKIRCAWLAVTPLLPLQPTV